VKLSSAGTLLWVSEKPVAQIRPAMAAGAGHLALVGSFRGTLVLGGVTMASPDANNNYAWFVSAIADTAGP
jgi:hypothetical protein